MTSIRTNTRFLTGGLAALAVTSTVTLAGPAQAADGDERACGLPAVPATYTTVFTEPVLREVPAVTHDEWAWERTLTTWEHEFSKVLAPATTESDWTRQLPTTTEHLWSRKVIDREAVAEVPETPETGHYELAVIGAGDTVGLVEYVQQQTGATRLERDGWNGEKGDDDNGKGWVKTGRGEVWVVDQAYVPGTPAVTELSHTETEWAQTSPGADWTGPLDTRVLGGGTESATTNGDVPAGAGWVQQATRTIPAVVDLVWAAEAPAGYDATGESRVLGTTTEHAPGTSATAPAGDGWEPVAGSLVIVVDEEASTIEVSPGSSKDVLLTPALPATAPCAVVVAGPQTGGPGGGTNAGADDTDSGDAGTQAAAGPVASVASVLPATGSPVSALLALGGLGSLLAGGVLVQVARRRQVA